jgi:FkbM family methyltransferase
MRRAISRVRMRAYRNRVARAAVRVRLPVLERRDIVRLGSDYGGWWVPEQAIKAGDRAYCAGVGDDVTFDVALIDRCGCEVWAFDPTPRVIEAVPRWDMPERWHFEAVGLWDQEEVIRFYFPALRNHGSLSATNAQGTERFVEGQVESLPAIMRRLGHDRLDLLKMDVEGAEGRVLDSMLASDIRPTVLCVEFDQPEVPWRTRRRVRALLAAGYAVVKVEHWNYTFLFVEAHPSSA